MKTISYPSNTANYLSGRSQNSASGDIKGIVLVPFIGDIEQLLSKQRTAAFGAGTVSKGCGTSFHFGYDPSKGKLYQFVSAANSVFLYDTGCALPSGTPLLSGESGGVSPNQTVLAVAVCVPQSGVFGAGAVALTTDQKNNFRCALSNVLTLGKVTTAGLTDASFFIAGSDALLATGSDRGTLLGATLVELLAASCPSSPETDKSILLTAARTLTPRDSGKTFFLNATAEFDVTLPAPFNGAFFRFVVDAAPSGANYRILTGSSANILVGQVISGKVTAVADTDSEVSGGDAMRFVDAKAVKGDTIELRSNGTSWFGIGYSKAIDGIDIITIS